MNQPWTGNFQFLPQFHDMHFQGIGDTIVAVVPNGFVDASFGQHLPRMTHQEHQQSGFSRRQYNAVSVAFNSLR